MFGCSTVMIEVWLLWLRLLTNKVMAILLGIFLNSLGGASIIDFPLSFLLSLALSVLGSLSSELSLLVEGIKMTLL